MPANGAFLDLCGLSPVQMSQMFYYSPQANPHHLANGNQYAHSESPKSGGPSPIESLNSLSPGGHSSSQQMSPQQQVPSNMSSGGGGGGAPSKNHNGAAAGKEALFDGEFFHSTLCFYDPRSVLKRGGVHN
jgi:hypothetical protein